MDLISHRVVNILVCTCILCFGLALVKGDDCIGMDQCSCQFSDGRKVALNSLGNSDGTAR